MFLFYYNEWVNVKIFLNVNNISRSILYFDYQNFSIFVYIGCTHWLYETSSFVKIHETSVKKTKANDKEENPSTVRV